ncbi:MAG TPA: OmpH family outer membrane protein [Rhodanobacteraceae bacterium]
MSFHRVVAVAGVAGVLMLPLAAVQAQTSIGNKSVPGVCMLSREAVLADSTVGKAADARFKQLVDQADSQLKVQQGALNHDIQQYRAKAKTLTAAEQKSQQESLGLRIHTFQTEKQKLDERANLTRAEITQKIGKVVNPLITSIYKQRGCGILLNRNVVLAGNQANDLTTEVVNALNKKMTTISFNLVPLPKQPQQSGK